MRARRGRRSGASTAPPAWRTWFRTRDRCQPRRRPSASLVHSLGLPSEDGTRESESSRVSSVISRSGSRTPRLGSRRALPVPLEPPHRASGGAPRSHGSACSGARRPSAGSRSRWRGWSLRFRRQQTHDHEQRGDENAQWLPVHFATELANAEKDPIRSVRRCSRPCRPHRLLERVASLLPVHGRSNRRTWSARATTTPHRADDVCSESNRSPRSRRTSKAIPTTRRISSVTSSARGRSDARELTRPRESLRRYRSRGGPEPGDASGLPGDLDHVLGRRSRHLRNPA